jgi:hypothetical protein
MRHDPAGPLDAFAVAPRRPAAVRVKTRFLPPLATHSFLISVNRIFYPLALLSVVAMTGVLFLGIYLHTFDIRNPKDKEAQGLATKHRLCGIAAGLSVLLVESVVITYFVGTSRWTKEVAETYRLDAGFIARSARLKRRTFPIAVCGMLIVVGITALGGAADPGSQLSRSLISRFGVSWADIHLGFAVLGIGAIVVGYYLQAQHIAANQQIIREVMAEVKRIRVERGLET